MTRPLSCPAAREALSARLDGEPADTAAVVAHLAGCPDCRDWQDQVHRLTRAARLDLPSPPPGLTERITTALRETAPATATTPPRAVPGRWRDAALTRAVLALVGCTELLLAVRDLAAGVAGTVPVHLEHEVSSLSAALGVAMLLPAIAPRRARAVLPVVAVAAGLLAVTALADAAAGRTELGHEDRHLLALVGCGLLLRLALRGEGHGRGSGSGNRPGTAESPRSGPPAPGPVLRRRYRHRMVTRRTLTALAVGLLSALAAVGPGAGPASAHSALESTDPAQGSQVQTSPASVDLTFSEGVGLSSRSIMVLDPRGNRVDTGAPYHPRGDTAVASVDLRPDLPKASYAVVWHVVSADSHPVSGTFSFGVGVPAGSAPTDAGTDPLVSWLHGTARLTAFLGTVLLLGGGYFAVLLWPAAAGSPRHRRAFVLGWLATLVSTAAMLLLEGPRGAGLGVTSVTDPDLLSTTLTSRYGQLLALRLCVLALAVPALRTLGTPGKGPGRWELGGFALLLVTSFSLSEHAGQGSWVPLAATLDGVHLLSAGVWLGGLATLVLALAPVRRGAAPVPGLTDLVAALPRWSRTAMAAVAALVVTGLYQAWREVGSLPALPATSYGRLLLAKAAGLALLLVLGDAGRRWIGRHVTAPASAPRPPVPVQPSSAAPVPVTTPAAVDVPAGTSLPAATSAGAVTSAAATASTAAGSSGAGTAVATTTGGTFPDDVAVDGTVLDDVAVDGTVPGDAAVDGAVPGDAATDGAVRDDAVPGGSGTGLPAGALTRLRLSVAAEVAVGVVVLGLTAALVDTVPARTAYAPPFSATVTGQGNDGTTISVVLDVAPTRTGPQTVHVYTYTPEGKVLSFQSVTATLVERSRRLGPIRFTLLPAGPGHAIADAVAVPAAGNWTLTAQIHTDATTDFAATATYAVH